MTVDLHIWEATPAERIADATRRDDRPRLRDLIRAADRDDLIAALLLIATRHPLPPESAR